MVFPRERHRAICDSKKNIYYSGGYNAKQQKVADTFELKSSIDNSHKELKQIPDQMMYHAMSIAQKYSKIFIYGGNKGATLKQIYQYDIYLNDWKQSSTLLPIAPMVLYAGSMNDSALVFDN